MDETEFQRRKTLARKWHQRANEFLSGILQRRYGIGSYEDLTSHPMLSNIVEKIYGELLDKHPKWFKVLMARTYEGSSFEDIARRFPGEFWRKDNTEAEDEEF